MVPKSSQAEGNEVGYFLWAWSLFCEERGLDKNWRLLLILKAHEHMHKDPVSKELAETAEQLC